MLCSFNVQAPELHFLSAAGLFIYLAFWKIHFLRKTNRYPMKKSLILSEREKLITKKNSSLKQSWGLPKIPKFPAPSCSRWAPPCSCPARGWRTGRPPFMFVNPLVRALLPLVYRLHAHGRPLHSPGPAPDVVENVYGALAGLPVCQIKGSVSGRASSSAWQSWCCLGSRTIPSVWVQLPSFRRIVFFPLNLRRQISTSLKCWGKSRWAQQNLFWRISLV